MKNVVGIGAIGLAVGFSIGIAIQEVRKRRLQKKLDVANKEIDYMKTQVMNFQMDLDDIDPAYDFVNPEEMLSIIRNLSDDAFEWFDYEHCAMNGEVLD